MYSRKRKKTKKKQTLLVCMRDKALSVSLPPPFFKQAQLNLLYSVTFACPAITCRRAIWRHGDQTGSHVEHIIRRISEAAAAAARKKKTNALSAMPFVPGRPLARYNVLTEAISQQQASDAAG